MVVPTRYTHAHNGIINRADFDRTVDLVFELVKKLDGDTVARIKDFTLKIEQRVIQRFDQEPSGGARFQRA